MVDAGCAVRSNVHAARRRDRGAGGAADDPAGFALGLYRSRVGDRCVCAVAGQRDSDLRRAGGQVRTKAGVHRRPGGVHRGVLCMRAGTDDGRPDLVACAPGSGRGCDVRHRLGPDRADVRGPRSRARDRCWGSTVGAAVATGPLVGGLLTDTLGWRWIFFVNVPIGIATIALATVKMVNIGDPDAKRLDIAGLVTFAGALFLMILGLLRGNDDGWGSTTILALFGGSALLAIAFIVAELRQERPMLDLSLFRKRGFVGVSLATFAIGAGMFAMYPYITLYLQNDLGYSPLAGGARLLPSTVLLFIVPLATRSVVVRFRPGAVLVFCMLVTNVGAASMANLSTGSTWTHLIPGLLLTGFGIGIVNPAIAKIGLGVVEPQRSGMA